MFLYGAGECAQGVGELDGQAGVSVEEGLDEGEGLHGVGVLAQVAGEVGEGFGQCAQGVRASRSAIADTQAGLLSAGKRP